MKRIALALALLLPGCATTDPLTRDGLWQPSGANQANLAAMVANPADLIRGREAEGSDGGRAAAAVARLRLDRVKPLPDSGVATFTTQAAPGVSSSTNGGTPATGESL